MCTVSSPDSGEKVAMMPRDSSDTPVWRSKTMRCSTTVAAAAKLAATLTLPKVQSSAILPSRPSTARGEFGVSACCASTTAGNSSYSTSTCSAASSAWARERAAMAATGAPCQHTSSMARGYCRLAVGILSPGMATCIGLQIPSRSPAQTTRTTPGMQAAAAVSMDRMAACAYVLRTKAMCSAPGAPMSST